MMLNSGTDVGRCQSGLPKAPVFGWDNLWPRDASNQPNVSQLPGRVFTSSGRAALYRALSILPLQPNALVLVPTYHCPTMVAPILAAGHRPVFYPITEDGLPNLEWLESQARSQRPAAMFAPHYFGLATSLRVVRDWCRRQGTVLVEDCAHAYFGMAGELPVGAWGDLATASLSKFFPVPEGGLLACAAGPLSFQHLERPTVSRQVRAIWDVVDFGCRNGRLLGVSQLLGPVRWLRDRKRSPLGAAEPDSLPTNSASPPDCDMERHSQKASAAARAVHALLPTGRIVTRRRANYAALVTALAGAPGVRLLHPHLRPGCVPYAMPLWVEGRARADRVYAALRQARMPVFRWDRIWPGTPELEGDSGRQWSQHLLQLLCHQDLSPEATERLAAAVLRGLNGGERA